MRMARTGRGTRGWLPAAAVAVCWIAAARALAAPPSPVRVNPLRAQSAAAATAADPAAGDPRAAALAARLRQAWAARAAARAGGAAASLDRARIDLAALRARLGDLEVRWRAQAGTPRQVRAAGLQAAVRAGKGADEDTARAFLRAHRDLMRVEDPDAELRLERRRRDELGRTQLRFAQRYQDLPVWPAELIVHLDPAGAVDLVDGAYVPTPRGIATRPALDAAAALERARARVPGAAAAAAGEPALIVYAPGDRPPRLAWTVELRVSPRARWRVVVDARGGAVLDAYNEVADENVAGSGADANGDVRPLDVWHEDGSYYLVDTSKPMYDRTSDPPSPASTRGAITVLDARNQPPTASPDVVPDLYYVTAAAPGGFAVPAAVSAAFGLAQVYDYYLERHGRSSLDGAGGGLQAIVRYGLGFHNAFWNGSAMYFGDGENYAGSLDVVAHELTHGVTQYTANLVYRDQPGALNESLSDIFGAAVEARSFGATDWLHGSQLGAPDRNLADPGAIAICDRCPGYPARFGEFHGAGDPLLDRFVNRDNGGVHINSSIVNHAFYLLADGLDDALGIGAAERIFYRALSAHLMASSQFVDARLACVASARELYGAGSREEQRTAAAFDAVEIGDGDSTPVPPPFPPVGGDDATLFLFWDGSAYALGRREAALGDGAEGVRLLDAPLAAARPAVTGDGSVAVFVGADADVCFVNTDGSPIDPEGGGVEQCLGFPGFISSVAVSPDGERFGFVFLDENGVPDNRLSVIDLAGGGETRTFTLRAPVFDGAVGVEVVNAGSMDFTADGATLVYEARNRIQLVDGSSDDAWSIYALDLASETISALVPPVAGLDIANPALSQTSDNFLVFDVYDPAAGDSTILAADLSRGTAAEIGTVVGGLGVPGYSGDDRAIVYSQSSATPTEFSLVRQALATDRLTPAGEPVEWKADADFGVIYRRGTFVGPGGCAGDCSGDGRVTIDELVKGVTIALGSAAASTCDAADADRDAQVTIAELIRAVNAALDGC